MNDKQDKDFERNGGQDFDKAKSGGKGGHRGKRQGKGKRGNRYGGGANNRNRTNTANDTKWWLPTNLTADEVASYPWNTMAGFDISTSVGGLYNKFNTSEAPNIAGIMKLRLQSTFPKSISGKSALNRASLGLFADILTKNSSNTSFEHTDLTMHIIALSDIDAILMKGIRAYGLIHDYPVKNRYLAKTLVEACGFNYEDLVSDPFDFIARLNIYINRRNRFSIPTNFSWRNREMWLSDCVYRDSDDEKSQFYVLSKDSYSIWSPRTSEHGSELKQKSISYEYGDVITRTEYFDLLDSMLIPLENDQDVYQMQGYILKRYGEDSGALVKFPKITADFKLNPVMDFEVLTMIQNSKVYRDDYYMESDAYTPLQQENGHFKYDPTLVTNAFNACNILLTSPHNHPSSDHTIEATRLIVPMDTSDIQYEYDSHAGHLAKGKASALNADFINQITFYTLKSNGTVLKFTYEAEDWIINLSDFTPKANYLISQLSYFDFHPIIPIINEIDTDENTYNFIGYMGDFDNTMILTQQNLFDMDEVLSYGLVNIVQEKMSK